MVDRAWGLACERPEQVRAEVALYRGVLMRMDGKDDTPAVGRLKTCLTTGFSRTIWSFEHVLGAADPKLSEEDRKLYRAMADAVLDAQKVAALDEFPRWKEIEPIPLDEPWEPLAG